MQTVRRANVWLVPEHCCSNGICDVYLVEGNGDPLKFDSAAVKNTASGTLNESVHFSTLK